MKREIALQRASCYDAPDRFDLRELGEKAFDNIIRLIDQTLCRILGKLAIAKRPPVPVAECDS